MAKRRGIIAKLVELTSPFQLTTNRHPSPESRVAAPARRKLVDATLRITLNGESRELPGPLSVADMLRHLGLKPEYVAVEVNKGLVTRSRQSGTMIAPGDVLEVVTLVGGGAPATLESEPLVIGTHVVAQPAVRGYG